MVSGPGFDPREEAVVERALPGLSTGGVPPAPGPDRGGSASTSPSEW